MALRRNGKIGLFFEQGTGKTRAALEALAALGCRRILVVAPLSVPGVWERETAKWWPEAQVTNCTSGTITRRAALLRQWGEGPRIVIVGYETYWREPLRTAIKESQLDAVVYDEAHRLKSRSARQSRFAHALVAFVPRAMALTGTPMPNGIEDLFSLYKAIDPDVFGTRWADFEARYIRRGGYLNYQIVGYRNVEEVEERLAATSLRITKAEALDLPEQVDVEVPVELTPSTREVYDRLRRKAISEVEGVARDGGIASGTTLARNVLTNVLRLQQITSGFARTTDGEILDLSTEKLDALSELLQDTPGRVVVFCRFTHDILRIARMLDRRAYVLDGSVPPRRRDAHLDLFRRSSDGVLVAQVAVASLGIDLTCANVAVFYSADYSLTNYLQARDRLHRIGQSSKVTYYHMVAAHTIDEAVYRALSNKEDLMRQVLDISRARELFAA